MKDVGGTTLNFSTTTNYIEDQKRKKERKERGEVAEKINSYWSHVSDPD